MPYPDLDPLDPLPLAFSCIPHKDAPGQRREPEQTSGSIFQGVLKPNIPDKAIEEGNWILAALPSRPPTTTKIHASQTTLQWLAEAFTWNVQPKSFQDVVPGYLYDFEDMFSKTSFDSLPEHKQWNHAIELVPDAEPSNCKVYKGTG